MPIQSELVMSSKSRLQLQVWFYNPKIGLKKVDGVSRKMIYRFSADTVRVSRYFYLADSHLPMGQSFNLSGILNSQSEFWPVSTFT